MGGGPSNKVRGGTISSFESQNAWLSGIVYLHAEAQISHLQLGPGGLLGLHPAATPQLFVVVGSSGWVSGEASGRAPITPGQVAFWEKGERHASGTDTGLAAIIIESERLDPTEFLPLE